MPDGTAKLPARRRLSGARIAGFSLAQRMRGRLTGARREPHQHSREQRNAQNPPRVSLLRRITRRSASVAPDPVSLVVLAIDHVGPAAVRACASGKAVSVAAPDEATAAVLRAALLETARRRRTDQLVRVVVD
jgi:hypothetical protein